MSWVEKDIAAIRSAWREANAHHAEVCARRVAAIQEKKQQFIEVANYYWRLNAFYSHLSRNRSLPR